MLLALASHYSLTSLITPRHGPRRKHSYPIATATIFMEKCLSAKEPRSNACLYLFVQNLLPSNGRFSVVCFAAVAYKRILFQGRSLATAPSLAPQFLL
jgi:hypothetical protein